jgi:hypothetical protein
MKWHPYAENYPLLQGKEYEAFQQDIATCGVHEAVKYRLVKGEKEYLDGRNRARVCEDLKIECPEEYVEVADDQVEAFIDSLNLHRRHLTKEQRRARVDALRAKGESLRDIADKLHVHHSTVAQDVTDIEDTSGVGNPTPEAVLGRDGKKYKARTAARRSGKPAPKKTPTPAVEADGETEPLLDSLDMPVPPGLVPVFRKAHDFQDIVNQLNSINRQLGDLHKHAAGDRLNLQAAQIDLNNLKEDVSGAMPYAVCPVCNGIAKTRKANCNCKQRGWLDKTSYYALPKEYRK